MNSGNIITRIDPGINGAIAEIDVDSGELLRISDMPTLIGEGAKNRRAMNAPLLAQIIFNSHATHAYCELVGPRPTDGVVGAFGFGLRRGIVEGICAAAGIPLTFIAAPSWKRNANIPAGKDNKDIARSRAISRWPSQASLFARKTDIDRAEACLIAISGISNIRANGLTL